MNRPAQQRPPRSALRSASSTYEPPVQHLAAQDIRTDMRDQISGLRNEVHDQIGGLRKEMHEGFAAINRRLDHIIQMQLDEHAAQIKKLETAVFSK